RTAADLGSAGLDVVAIIDSRRDVPPHLRPPARVISGGEVIAAKGGKSLRSITVRSPHATENIEADGLAISGGWNPNVALTCHHGSRPTWKEDIAAFVPTTPPKGMTVVGAASGTMTLAAGLAEGAQAGQRAVKDLGFSTSTDGAPKADDETCAVTPLWHI